MTLFGLPLNNCGVPNNILSDHEECGLHFRFLELIKQFGGVSTRAVVERLAQLSTGVYVLGCNTRMTVIWAIRWRHIWGVRTLPIISDCGASQLGLVVETLANVGRHSCWPRIEPGFHLQPFRHLKGDWALLGQCKMRLRKQCCGEGFQIHLFNAKDFKV